MAESRVTFHVLRWLCYILCRPPLVPATQWSEPACRQKLNHTHIKIASRKLGDFLLEYSR
jgi:hypothetical protein